MAKVATIDPPEDQQPPKQTRLRVVDKRIRATGELRALGQAYEQLADSVVNKSTNDIRLPNFAKQRGIPGVFRHNVPKNLGLFQETFVANDNRKFYSGYYLLTYEWDIIVEENTIVPGEAECDVTIVYSEPTYDRIKAKTWQKRIPIENGRIPINGEKQDKNMYRVIPLNKDPKKATHRIIQMDAPGMEADARHYSKTQLNYWLVTARNFLERDPKFSIGRLGFSRNSGWRKWDCQICIETG